jgi:hypothetical protein
MKQIKKRVAIMQPYFFPYVGYFQLISDVDEFVIYDEIKYTKKSWINRNRIEFNGFEKKITLPLKNASDYLNINERTLSDEFDPNVLYRIFKLAYQKSQNWDEVDSLLKRILFNRDVNLFNFILHSTKEILNVLEIKTKITISSSLNLSPEVKGVDRVLAICKELGATEYLNPVGGRELYDKKIFQDNYLDLYFLKSKLSNYASSDSIFLPAMSIIDLLCKGNLNERKKQILLDYDIIAG